MWKHLAGSTADWLLLAQGATVLTVKGTKGGDIAPASTYSMSAAAYGQASRESCESCEIRAAVEREERPQGSACKKADNSLTVCLCPSLPVYPVWRVIHAAG